MDERGWQHWPEGADLGISVHPDRYRTANTLYCAFVRMFGNTKTALTTIDEKRDEIFKKLDDEGFAAIPPPANFAIWFNKSRISLKLLAAGSFICSPFNPPRPPIPRSVGFGVH